MGNIAKAADQLVRAGKALKLARELREIAGNYQVANALDRVIDQLAYLDELVDLARDADAIPEKKV